MTSRFIIRNGKKMHLISSADTKTGAEASRKAIKDYTNSKKSLVVKLSKKQAKKEDAKYGVYFT